MRVGANSTLPRAGSGRSGWANSCPAGPQSRSSWFPLARTDLCRKVAAPSPDLGARSFVSREVPGSPTARPAPAQPDRWGRRRPGRRPTPAPRAQGGESRSRSGLRPALPGANFCVGPAQTSRAARGRGRGPGPIPWEPGRPSRRRPGGLRGGEWSLWGPRAPARLPARPGWAAARNRRDDSRAHGPPSLPRPPGPGLVLTWLPGRTRAQPGAPRPRARRGQGRRPGGERTAARAAPTLPPESGVEHSASPSRANEEGSRGNSTTYLRARNGGPPARAPQARGLAAAQTRRRAGRGAAIGAPGLHPEGHPPQSPGAR